MKDEFFDFYRKPWKGASEMDVLDWFAFIGVILVMLILWNIILRHIKDAL